MVGERVDDRMHRFRQSFKKGADSFKSQVSDIRKTKKVPHWVRVTHKYYHDYGLKHLCLIIVLIIYQFIGAGIFYYCEHSNEESKELQWKEELKLNRSSLIKRVIKTFHNNNVNTNYGRLTTKKLENELTELFKGYERDLDVSFTDQKIKWDFWNAMLYAQMITTTIGGGFAHLYPSTVAGRIFTMIYAFFGIPLVLTILDDLGKILIKWLKTPWFLIKCCCRRTFRYCTKQSMAEIKKLDDEDKKDLEVFDLPLFVAVFVVLAWIFICSATFCIWEEDWDYFVAFYFFFISLSTIGLGDISPSQPKYLLILFIYIIIGLSLVSMCINLIQIKLERTYQTGRDDVLISDSITTGVKRKGSSLGVLRAGTSSFSLTREAVQRRLNQRRMINKCSQTLLSFPSPSKNSYVTQSVLNSKVCPRTLSIDDVMKLVDTEEGDIILLTELTRDHSTFSELSEAMKSDFSDPSQQIVISKSFESNFQPRILKNNDKNNRDIAIPKHNVNSKISNCPSATPLLPQNLDIEALEEMEDRFLLSRAASFDANPSVHFRSRLSLIMEHQGGMESEEDSSIEPSKSSTKTSISSTTDEYLGERTVLRHPTKHKRTFMPSTRYHNNNK